MRVLVCGGRDYADTETVTAVLDAIADSLPKGERLEICEGDAGGWDRGMKLFGADKIAGNYAIERHLVHHCYPVTEWDWKNIGKVAGPQRNMKMLKEFKPQLVVAFPGGKGTANMVEISRKAGVEVLEI